MRPAHARTFVLLLIISLAALLQTGPLHAAPPEEIVGVPQMGPVGAKETLSQIMARQAELEAAGLAKHAMRDKEGKTVKPDRSNLSQNPDSPDASQFPASASMPGRSPEQGGPALTPQVVGTNFTGATLSGTNPTYAFPPDCMGAVGPTQYVVFVNGRLVTFNKTTGVSDGVLNADPDVFFGSVVNGSYTSDPRVRYDRLTGQWFLVIINVSTPNRILIAVSDAANAGSITPSTVFTFFYIPIDTTPPTISSTCLADYPTLGLDANALYIGTNNFCGSPSQTFNSSDGYVVRKSSIMGAGPMVVTPFRGLVASSTAAGPYTRRGSTISTPPRPKAISSGWTTSRTASSRCAGCRTPAEPPRSRPTSRSRSRRRPPRCSSRISATPAVTRGGWTVSTTGSSPPTFATAGCGPRTTSASPMRASPRGHEPATRRAGTS